MEIKRVPIKIREPILLDVCTCYEQLVIAVDGEPKLIQVLAKNAGYMLQDIDGTLPISIYDRPSIGELQEIMKYKVPVHLWVGHDIEYGFEVIDLIKSVPHSVLIISTACGLPMDYEELRRLLKVAKSHKVMVTLSHLANRGTSKIDLMSEVEQVKNFISHVLIQGPVSERMMLDMEKYLKERKITCEWLEITPIVKGKVRFTSSINENLPLGIRTFSYNKDKSIGTFVEGEVEEQICCQKCGKPIF